MRLGIRILRLFRKQLVVLALEVYLADVADGNGCADDAYHTERIGAGVARGDVEVHAVPEDAVQCLVGSAETRRVRHGSVKCTHHHRQVLVVGSVEENEVAGEHHEDIQQDGRRREKVQLESALSEALEEARPDLQTDHEDEKNQTEVL